MKPPRQTLNARAQRAERRAMLALVAAFALLVQALIPSLAGAAPSPLGGLGDGVICTSLGPQTAPTDGGAPAHVGRCDHCVCPATTADLPPPAVEAAPATFAYVRLEPRIPPAAPPPPARAPPRPPGQGPPSPNA